MIVDPDFPDHWKTRLLVGLLGDDEVAPMYLIRLWAHCQQRKAWEFDLPTAALKAICRYNDEAAKLENALAESGFIKRDGARLIVVGWDEHNANLVASWENGAKGGRPAKKAEKPAENRTSPATKETHGKPTGNPAETRGFPVGNPRLTHGVTDKEDKEDKEEEVSPYPLKSKSDPLFPDDEPRASETKKPVPPDLIAWIEWWNRLHSQNLVFAGISRDPPSESTLRGWNRYRKDAKLRASLADRDALEREIRAASITREAWFTLAKLFGGKNRDGDLICDKLLAGGYRDRAPPARAAPRIIVPNVREVSSTGAAR